jgi:hypothetical protein
MMHSSIAIAASPLTLCLERYTYHHILDIHVDFLALKFKKTTDPMISVMIMLIEFLINSSVDCSAIENDERISTYLNERNGLTSF